MPSFSLDPVLLSHYADRIPALEQRFLVCLLLLASPATRVAFLTATAPPRYAVDAFLNLLPDTARANAEERCLIVAVGDASPRPLAEKLLERPDLVEAVRQFADDRPAMIEPWNVTPAERDLAIALDMPMHGSAPELWRLATKSGSRRLFRDEGVPLPDGVEGVANSAQVVSAIVALRSRNRLLAAVVVKLDDSVSGDGNAVIDLSGLPAPGSGDERDAVAARLLALPGWYMEQLAAAPGIVETRIDGVDFRSPSCQATVTPEGEVRVLSTHEQVLGGHSGQVYQGCIGPADVEYATELGSHGAIVGARLAREGVVGRFSVDFAAVRGGAGWDVYALEINLRKGGTTHPFAAARWLREMEYDPGAGRFTAADGHNVCYVATDNLLDPAWKTTLSPETALDAVHGAGLAFSRGARRGVVLHMLSCLPIDGRLGLTAIGETLDEARDLYDATAGVIAAAAAR